MGWFGKKGGTLGAVISHPEGTDEFVTVDVRGQTCPGYLLSINKAVDPLPAGTPVRLVVSYPPAGEDVKSWCNMKGHRYQGVTREADYYLIVIESGCPTP